MKTCSTCRYGVPAALNIRCHRYPPTVVPTTDWGRFPLLEPTDWCGEHRASNDVSDPLNALPAGRLEEWGLKE